MTQQQLVTITGRSLPEDLDRALNYAALKYGITSRLRLDHFLAQLLHETGAFRWNRELWGPTYPQRRYEGRKDLGNLQEGDGFKFRGRGYIQLTGRTNYQSYSDHIGVDFCAFPDLVAELPFAADVAGWYWDHRGINRLADADDLLGVTRAINGGTNGLADRRRWLERVRHHGATLPSEVTL